MRYVIDFNGDEAFVDFSETLCSKDLLLVKDFLCRMIDNRIEDIKKLEGRELTFEDSIRSMYPPLSMRTQNILLRAGFKTIGDVMNCTKTDLVKIRNMGKKSLDEVEDKFSRFGKFKGEE